MTPDLRDVLRQQAEAMRTLGDVETALRRARSRHHARAAVAISSIALVAGLVVGGGVWIAADPPSRPAAEPAVTASVQSTSSSASFPTSLTCNSSLRVDGNFDNWLGKRSHDTPQQIGDRFADPAAGERALVAPDDGDSVTVFIVRKDGTAHTRIDVAHSATLGWQLESILRCAERAIGPADPASKCAGSERHFGSPFYTADSRGFRTPGQAMKLYMTSGLGGKHQSRLKIERSHRPVLGLLLQGGNVRAKAEIVRTPSGGWLVDSIVYC